MSDEQSFIDNCGRPHLPVEMSLDEETALLLDMAEQLSSTDAATLAAIVRRTLEICEGEGEEVALAVLDQVEAILHGRGADA